MITMEYKLIKDMFPEYLKDNKIELTEDRIIIYFVSKKKSFQCLACNNPSDTRATYFTRKYKI